MLFSGIFKILSSVYPNDEDQRIAKILFFISTALLVAYLLILGTALVWGDTTLAILCLLGEAALLGPLAMLLRGKIHASGFILILGVLFMATLITTTGQGFHDTGIMAFPVIIAIASLILPRKQFMICSALTLVAVGWLVFGELTEVYHPRPNDPTSATDFLVMGTVLCIAILAADLLSSHMRKNLQQAEQEIAQRKILEEQLRYQSMHDALTGIFNRAFFEVELERLKQSRDYPVSIIAADVNNLKTLNDTQGHAAGDELLKRAARVLSEVFRSGDVLARVGGDEFAVLLSRTDAATAESMLERIRLKICEHNLEHPGFPLQIALGYSTAEAGQLAEAIVVADQHMYQEKALQKAKL